MKIDSERLDNHQVKLTVEIDADQFEGVKRQAARKISRRTKIAGFRPGKAPYPVVQRHVGEAAVLEEALDLLIDDIYPQVIEESEIKPYGPGSLENIVQPDPPILEFIVPLAPHVVLGDYHAISYPYDPEPVSEEDIQDVLKQVQENQAIVEPVERPAAIGDIAYLLLSGEERLNEENDEAGAQDDEEGAREPVTVPEQRLNVLIKAEGEEDDAEWPFSGFTQELTGLSAGDNKTISHSYPADEPNETFAGRTISFEITVNEVKSRALPPIDDTLAQSVGDYDGLAELREYIEETLKTNKLEAYHAEYDNQVLEDLIEKSTIEYPPQMVKQELEVVLDQLKDRLASQGLDIDIYLKTREMDQEALDKELLPTAEQRIKRGLVLFEVAKVESLEVDPGEVEQEVSRTVDQIFQIMPEKEARARLTGDAVQNLVGQIMSDKMAQLAIKRLRAIASGTLEQETETETAEADEPSDPDAQPDETTVADDGGATLEAASAVEDPVGAPVIELKAVEDPDPSGAS